MRLYKNRKRGNLKMWKNKKKPDEKFLLKLNNETDNEPIKSQNHKIMHKK